MLPTVITYGTTWNARMSRDVDVVIYTGLRFQFNLK